MKVTSELRRLSLWYVIGDVTITAAEGPIACDIPPGSCAAAFDDETEEALFVVGPDPQPRQSSGGVHISGGVSANGSGAVAIGAIGALAVGEIGNSFLTQMQSTDPMLPPITITVPEGTYIEVAACKGIVRITGVNGVVDNRRSSNVEVDGVVEGRRPMR